MITPMQNIFIPKSLAKAFKVICQQKEVTMTSIAVQLISKWINEHGGNIEEKKQIVVNIESKPVGRPSLKASKPFLRCPVEYDILRHPDMEKGFSELTCKPPKPISLRIVQDGSDYAPYGLLQGQAHLVTYHLFCIATAESEHVNGMIDACDYEKMLAFHGMLGQVDVKRNGDSFYPVNELAKMLLELYPRRSSFDKASLVFFDMALELSINIID